ncbi:fumarate hydratase [Francisella hispaniensis]|uniref:Fumarate hydratase class I n=2 Tax=Francisella hispaniensis TaxID=622488 RepID=F4BJ26_9GAMM|nr:fumarate hydratase [Francisella hispaniensis]AEB28170.1 Fumarate hydratase class I, aerobic [Francisella hispaniensis]APD49922.1 fumarate hydratase [Francisella hispaniensis FSC454]KYW86287.1 fumarate hydratase [Francisella hispaniensis FSC454]
MAVIKAEDLVNSVAEALQYISYYHPKDFIDAMYQAYQREESKPAKDAMAQILINSRMSAIGKRPICQDTGMVCAFVKVGMDAKLDKTDRTITELVNEGVRRGYNDPHNPLRASMVFPPHGARKNTKDNTPAIVHIDLVHGDKIEVDIAAKGGGSEFKSKFKVLNPSDSIIDWVEEMLPTMGAGWCPPGIIGIGIGGTAEKAMLLAKESLSEEINIQDIIKNGPQNDTEQLRLDIYNRVNALGIGAQGLGGLTTVLDVKINEYPTHAACKPVALIPNCAATRHVHFVLDGSGAVDLPVPKIEDWPVIEQAQNDDVKRINLDTVTREEIEALRSGDNVLISGKILTGRDAAHKRLQDMYSAGEEFPVSLKDRFIYYVGPVDPVGDEVVGPAGPTTATRMDKFTPFMLEKAGIMGMIGKSERGQATIDSIKKNKAIYLMGVGGAAYLISKSIKKAEVVAFEDLGMEAIYEFEVEDMPVTVAVDSLGVSAHQQGPKLWKQKIAKINRV